MSQIAGNVSFALVLFLTRQALSVVWLSGLQLPSKDSLHCLHPDLAVNDQFNLKESMASLLETIRVASTKYHRCWRDMSYDMTPLCLS